MDKHNDMIDRIAEIAYGGMAILMMIVFIAAIIVILFFIYIWIKDRLG